MTTSMDSMDRRIFLGALTSGIVAGPVLAARHRTQPASRTNAFEWTEVASGRAWVTGGSTTGGAVLAVRSEDQALVVDSKFAGLAPLLRSEAETRLGCPITNLINTHHHGDHTGGNVAFADCQMLAHTGTAYRVSKSIEGYKQQVASADRMFTRLGDDAAIEAAVKAFSPLGERASTLGHDDWVPGQTINRYPMYLRLGRMTIVLHHFGPGHTDNDVIVQIPELNLMHCGDLFFNRSHPFFDPNGGTSAAGWTRCIQHALDLCDEKTVVIAGHGAFGDKESLGEQLRYVESIVRGVREAHANGLSREEITAMSWPFMDGLDREGLRSRAIAAVFDELFPADG